MSDTLLHAWSDELFMIHYNLKWVCCTRCGAVRQANGSNDNKRCPGVVKIGIREVGEM